MSEVRILPCGPRAVLFETDEGSVQAVAVALAAVPGPGVVQIVPGACTVLVEHDGAAATIDALTTIARTAVEGHAPPPPGPLVTIDVRYDGTDLMEVAARTRMTRDEVVALHRSGEYTVAFCGFAPGFAYLRGLPAALHLPRRTTPRTRVPAGSVAIAGEYASVYPVASPGGWHLLGSTDVVLWDESADPPALLRPGTRVTFREITP